MSKIEWTDKTWNPIVGCSVVSPGCTNCYAMKMAARLEAMAGDGLDDNGYAVRGTHPLGHYRGTTRKVKGNAVWTGKLALAPESILLEPLRRKKSTMYFVNSMSDLFHESVPDEWIDRVFAVMALCPQHTFQVLTKRSARMRTYCEGMWDRREALGDLMSEIGGLEREGWYAPECDGKRGWSGMCVPLPNVWLGVSAEDQRRADERIPDLLATPAAVRFVSAEPLLGPIDFTSLPSVSGIGRHLDALSNAGCAHADIPSKLDWVIVGGESGPDARPMHPDWARSIRDQCQDAGVSFFFKQWGGFAPVDVREGDDHVDPWRGDVSVHRVDHGYRRAYMRRIGKKRAGRLLDGREWSEMPSADHGRVAA